MSEVPVRQLRDCCSTLVREAAEVREPPLSRRRLDEERGGTPSLAPAGDRIQLLKELGELKERGVLTEEEFAAEKARLLQT